MNVRKPIPGLGEQLREARSRAGLTQQQAGERSGVHPVSIAKFEAGKTVPTLAALYQLAEAYGVNVCDLLPEGERTNLPTDSEPSARKRSKEREG